MLSPSVSSVILQLPPPPDTPSDEYRHAPPSDGACLYSTWWCVSVLSHFAISYGRRRRSWRPFLYPSRHRPLWRCSRERLWRGGKRQVARFPINEIHACCPRQPLLEPPSDARSDPLLDRRLHRCNWAAERIGIERSDLSHADVLRATDVEFQPVVGGRVGRHHQVRSEVANVARVDDACFGLGIERVGNDAQGEGSKDITEVI
mmetsp:Transcript_70102/g.102729  ORF Transcript_70102/g.102729 Transcript_70102/m.102729 type:complete len:204 (-) Transcript_70102:489-1100(-)